MVCRHAGDPPDPSGHPTYAVVMDDVVGVLTANTIHLFPHTDFVESRN